MSRYEGGMDCSFSLREDRFGVLRPVELWVMHMINAMYKARWGSETLSLTRGYLSYQKEKAMGDSMDKS